MSHGRLTRQIALFAGGVAIVGMGALTACSSSAKDSPSTTTTPTTTVAPSPTEKAVSPGGANSFSPTVNPAPPGTVCKEIVGNNCVR
ncbi:hypothetical protein FHT40_006521 [Mycolicibacterium sp. BK556]|uniref:hypothetical protein n=1 Tax=unclassified Mycolicibacterium TaxID=2636767 RepID=UPI00161EACDF|nr:MULTISPECIES: hypothetical protein [unclassified Mycolicibacterium]MBB3606828.1 hypothetical protein [Mycolicibacterium sp. BK556]MBB3636506.1 hypothetical protein [Mycolicibacterium sp. BK607]MBB3754407.1 hypothetical protein [Mycolicibacterium sp. BK634]